jgi:predicted nucleic acid-binding protein
MNEGLVDTNVFVHALLVDERSAECRAFLDGVRDGSISVEVHPLVVHELTYIFMRFRVFADRRAIAEYIRSVLQWPGIVSDVTTLDRALDRWGGEQRVAFVDAFLVELALRDNLPVYTMNRRDFEPFGVQTPSPLPSGS